MGNRASWEEFAENYYKSKRNPYTSELEEKLSKIEKIVNAELYVNGSQGKIEDIKEVLEDE